MAAESALLDVEGLRSGYGPIQVLHGVSLRVGTGEAVAVLGPNGAGKSTLLGTIAGLIRARSGAITLAGRPLTRMPAERVVREGVALVPERRELFAPMTVAENLEIGAYGRRGRAQRAAVQRDLEQVLSLFPRLRERASQQAGSLSGGEQQMLAIGRALMSAPRVLLLDEPSLGLSPKMIDAVFEALETLSRRGLTMLVVEQNVSLALDVAQRAYVLRNGRVMLSGATAEIQASPEVGQLYLGHA